MKDASVPAVRWVRGATALAVTALAVTALEATDPEATDLGAIRDDFGHAVSIHRRMDRGHQRRDVQRQKRGAHPTDAPRRDRAEEGPGLQVAPRRALRRHLPGVEP